MEIGIVEAIYRYPVKSMAGERVDAAEIGWHGIEGDRRLGLRRVGDRGGFPWLTASKFPELVLYAPMGGADGKLPTHVRLPEGGELEIFGEELAAEVGRRYGSAVEMLHMKHGIFDDASISVIAAETVRGIARLAGRGEDADARRFRPNIVVRSVSAEAFEENEWVGGAMTFGEGAEIAVTMRDVRCSMVNLDPESGKSAPEVLKAVVGANENCAGVYGVVVKAGRVEVGMKVRARR